MREVFDKNSQIAYAKNKYFNKKELLYIMVSHVPAEYQPISMWGYFGYQILFSIPVIGWIFVIIFALTASNRNLRNFARSQFCLWIIWLVLICVSSLTGFFTMLLENLVH